MQADISIISDVDMHVTNGETLANGLIDFLPGNKYGKELDEGGTACLSRISSRVADNIPPQLVSGDKGLSYCFAIFRPSDNMAMKYKGIMSKGPKDYTRAMRKGALSDQDLFTEVFKSRHVLLPIRMVFFPFLDEPLRRFTEISGRLPRQQVAVAQPALAGTGSAMCTWFRCDPFFIRLQYDESNDSQTTNRRLSKQFPRAQNKL
jgi:hypothetical protein